MTYQTKLLNFYWERLGYENHSLPAERKHDARSPAGNPREKSEAVRTIESSELRNEKEDSAC
jgi:hypothetical protein